MEFWDYSSINSIRNLAYLKKWQELYGPLGFQIIGIHSPDFDFAYKKENLKAAIKRLGIDYPVLMDNDFKVWKSYEVFSWPTQLIIDHNGKIVHRQIGEGHYREAEEQIRKFLSVANRKTHLPPLAASKDYQDLFDTRQRSRTTIQLDQMPMIGIQIFTDARIHARRFAASRFDLRRFTRQPVHIRRRPAQIGNNAGKAWRFIAD